jgi:[protein-PII] uridylyltransferase
VRAVGEDEVFAIAGSPDSATATERFVAARTELLRRPGPPGPGRRRALVALTDDWLAELYRLGGGGRTGGALVAIGGYGRGDLAPGSDLDLLLLHDGRVGELPDRIWYPIWDSRLRLDHSVRTLAEARRLAAQDFKVLLGLLDARAVAGDEMLVERLVSSVRADWRGFAGSRMEELRASVDERRERSGELAHLLEPDLKESFGGLRDLTILRAVAASWITDMPHSGLAGPTELILDARDALHGKTGRSNDRLLMQEQQAVALALGYPDSDMLMRSVSAAGRAIGHAADTTWYQVGRATRRSARRPFRRIGSRSSRSPLADGVVSHDGEAVLAEGARPDRDPVLALRAAAAAAQAGLRLSPHTVQRLAAESAPLAVPWPPSARDALVSLLGAGRSTLPVWESLDQAGIVENLLPGWGAIRSAPQHNPVHRFTVDRHLVETAIQASRFQREVSRPDLLLVAALFHDIGKGRHGIDHTELGVDLMIDIAPHLGFDTDDSETLVALVQHHLLLPETATRRDPDDPAIIDAVAEAVADVQTLDLLHALTRADAAATGPAAWSQWRAALIADLVSRVRAVLSGGSGRSAPVLRPIQQRMVAAGTVDLIVEDRAPGGLLRVSIAAPDRLGLLATVAGVLALNRLDVRGARAFPSGDMALSEWTVDPSFGEPPDPVRLREDLRRALAGTLDIAERLRRRESDYPAPERSLALEPRVEVVNDASDRATVVEVRTYDRPGALFRLASAITESGIDVMAARADSMGSNVVDVFYLRAPGGGPLDYGQTAQILTQLTEVASTSGR